MKLLQKLLDIIFDRKIQKKNLFFKVQNLHD